jgi:16S rRNA (guanine966-N2)-methyltransferase
MNAGALALIAANARGTLVELVRKDVRKLKPDVFTPQAVIFADPPYGDSLNLWTELAPKVASWLLPDGVLVWESDQRTELPVVPCWKLVDSRQYGAARFHFFEPAAG